MASVKPFDPQGVIPACLLAFDDEHRIDERWSRKHLRDLAAVDGLSAITVNGHAAEVHALSLDEQKRTLAFSSDEVGDQIPLVCGVYADGSQQAAQIARMAEDNGASALLIMPPLTTSMGGILRPEMLRAHYHEIAAATSLPLVFFLYPHTSGLYVKFDDMLRLLDEVPSICAIKDWCHDGRLHERNIRELQSRTHPVNVLTTHSAWLMASLVMGCKGLLSGAGSVIASLQVALFRAVAANDLEQARAINDRIYPIAQAFYADPFLDMHNRMKEANVLLGRLPKAVVRLPLMKLSDGEIERIRLALIQGGLLEQEHSA